MKCFFFLFCTILLFGCQSQSNTYTIEKGVVETVNLVVNPIIETKPSLIDLKTDALPYDSVLARTEIMRQALNQSVIDQEITLDSVENYFSFLMVENIFPYWKGTPWDFNGHTDTPQEDNVACGYFVSTPLKHVGFKLNRYKLAQQASLNIVKSLALTQQVKSFHNPTLEEMITEIKQTYKKGLYVVGLSNHVGFLYLDEEELYFIHSNYAEPFGVVAEVAQESSPFIYSDVYYIAPISSNNDLMRKWLSGSSLNIVGS